MTASAAAEGFMSDPRSRSRVRCGKTDRDGRNVRDGVGRGGRLHERSEGPPVEVEVVGSPRKDGPRRKECP